VVTRLALALVGGVLGFTASQFLVQPVSAFFGPATIVWNASTCPAGLYTVYSFVRAANGNFVDSATVTGVELPRATFTQQFSNLPAGSLKAGAMAFISGGAAFRAETQTVQSAGGGGDRSGRTKPATATSVGFASARNAAPKPPPTEPRSTVSAAPAATPAAVNTDQPAPEIAVRRLLRQLNITLDPGGDLATWRQLVLEDTDDDGAVDSIIIESTTGALWVIRLR
jgi:hypothetical protein